MGDPRQPDVRKMTTATTHYVSVLSKLGEGCERISRRRFADHDWMLYLYPVSIMTHGEGCGRLDAWGQSVCCPSSIPSSPRLSRTNKHREQDNRRTG